VRDRAAAAGIDGDFARYSLRAGFATTAARAGRTEAAIMRHGRWTSVHVARRYIRHGSRWIDNFGGRPTGVGAAGMMWGIFTSTRLAE